MLVFVFFFLTQIFSDDLRLTGQKVAITILASFVFMVQVAITLFIWYVKIMAAHIDDD